MTVAGSSSSSSSSQLSLKRIHLFLRQLNSITSSLIHGIDSNNASNNAIVTAQAIAQGVATSATAFARGKGKNKQVDEEYNIGTKKKVKVTRRRLSGAASSISRDGMNGTSIDSPFTSTSSAVVRVSTTYKSRKLLATSSSSFSSANPKPAPRLPSTVARATQYLLSSGVDGATTAKALQLFRVYSTIVDLCSSSCSTPRASSSSNTSRPSNPSDRSSSTTTPSLVECMAKKMGWGIEEAVAACVAYSEELKDREEGFDSHSDQSDDEGSSAAQMRRKRRRSKIDEEDENLLIDEWYESVPTYSWKWVLAQHATSIVVHRLGNSLPALTHLFMEVCIDHGASAEAIRFFPPLLSIGFASYPSALPSHHQATPHSRTTPHRVAHALSLTALEINRTSIYLEALEAHLLASPFAARLFYSPFLSLARIPVADLHHLNLVRGALSVVARVGMAMLGGISEEGEGEEVEKLKREVVDRVEAEIGVVLKSLLRCDGAGEDDSIRQRREDELIEALFEMVQNFNAPALDHKEGSDDGDEQNYAEDGLTEMLGRVTASLVLARIAAGGNDVTANVSILGRLFALSISISPSTYTRATVAASLISLCSPLLAHLSPPHHRTMIDHLRKANLVHLEAAIIDLLLNHYSSISSSAKKVVDWGVEKETRELMDEWGESLIQAERRCITFEHGEQEELARVAKSSSSTIVNGEKHKVGWRYEEMLGAYVTVTPEPARAARKGIRRSLLSNEINPLSFSTPQRHTALTSTPLALLLQHHPLPLLPGSLLPPRTIERLTLMSVQAQLKIGSHLGSPSIDTPCSPSGSSGGMKAVGGRRVHSLLGSSSSIIAHLRDDEEEEEEDRSFASLAGGILPTPHCYPSITAISAAADTSTSSFATTARLSDLSNLIMSSSSPSSSIVVDPSSSFSFSSSPAHMDGKSDLRRRTGAPAAAMLPIRLTMVRKKSRFAAPDCSPLTKRKRAAEQENVPVEVRTGKQMRELASAPREKKRKMIKKKSRKVEVVESESDDELMMR